MRPEQERHHPNRPPHHGVEPPHHRHEPPHHHPEPPGHRPEREPSREFLFQRMNRFLQPRLLLLLAERKQSYGYELIDGLSRLGFGDEATDPGAIYRSLRGMEGENLLVSEWDTEGTGAARRVYRLTPEGEEMLHSWMANLRQRKASLELLLNQYEAYLKTERAEPDTNGKEISG